jgi:hypothetical protein
MKEILIATPYTRHVTAEVVIAGLDPPIHPKKNVLIMMAAGSARHDDHDSIVPPSLKTRSCGRSFPSGRSPRRFKPYFLL